MANILLTIYERRKIYYDTKGNTNADTRENLCSSILYSGGWSSNASLTALDVHN